MLTLAVKEVFGSVDIQEVYSMLKESIQANGSEPKINELDDLRELLEIVARRQNPDTDDEIKDESITD